MKITKLFLVRHGETYWNLEGRLQGHLDSDLTEVGIAQAEALAKGLQPYDFDAIYSSDLGRAYRTTQYIAAQNEWEIRTDSRLREWNLGIFQGFTKTEIAHQFPQEFHHYEARQPDYVIPNGESITQFFERCAHCFEGIAQQHLGEQVLVVAHGGVLTNLFKYTLGIAPEAPRRFTVPNTSLNIFSYQNPGWILECWGDLSHLRYLRSLDDT